MVRAAIAAMATGPSATVDSLVGILKREPHSLPDAVADGIIIGARIVPTVSLHGDRTSSHLTADRHQGNRVRARHSCGMAREPRFDLTSESLPPENADSADESPASRSVTQMSDDDTATVSGGDVSPRPDDPPQFLDLAPVQGSEFAQMNTTNISPSVGGTWN